MPTPSKKLGQKLRRETARFREQFASYGEYFEDRRRLKDYEAQKDQLTTTVAGKVPATPKIAIVLIYQPAGLNPSVLMTCRFLLEKGFAPYVVSNGPLSDPDLTRLCGVVWKILIRPNQGHDFAGYKDGVLSLESERDRIDRLIVMNDSTWFPTTAQCDFLDRLEATGADVIGGHRMPRRPWELNRILIPSYFYLFSNRAVRSRTFWRFWHRYVPSRRVYGTVKRGEHALSRVMALGGLKCRALYGTPEMRAVISALPDDTLRGEIAFSDPNDPADRAERAQLLAEDQMQTERARALLQRLAGRNFTAELPLLSLRGLGHPFVKRKAALFSGVHATLLRAHDTGRLPDLVPEVIDEMRTGLDALKDAAE
ncbi:MAG: hypothetical protein HRU32_11750 [Rhodobacteraceae bacterium]|nr:hypothetical protein [Paracoccaceae bacterium]